MISSKYLYDEGCDDEVFNDEWALSGDVDVKRVNDLERDFLRAIDWHLYVHPHEFSSILNVAETELVEKLSNHIIESCSDVSSVGNAVTCEQCKMFNSTEIFFVLALHWQMVVREVGLLTVTWHLFLIHKRFVINWCMLPRSYQRYVLSDFKFCSFYNMLISMFRLLVIVQLYTAVLSV